MKDLYAENHNILIKKSKRTQINEKHPMFLDFKN